MDAVPAEPSWLVIARRELGVHETPGAASTPRVDEYLAAGHAHPGDEQPWCSAFANWSMQQAGLPGTGRLAARSWLTWGESLSVPKPGCVCVLWRDDPNGPHGHVGFWMRETMGLVFLLGGNQGSDQGPSYGGIVSVRGYPRARVLGYRWPSPDMLTGAAP